MPYTFRDVVTAAQQNLSRAKFVVSRNVMLPGGNVADLVASHIEPPLLEDGDPSVVQHLFLKHAYNATGTAFNELFEAGFQYTQDENDHSLLRGRCVMRIILACIAVDAAAPALVEFATKRPPMRWMRFEFPVLFDLSTGRVWYCQKTPRMGSMFFPGVRALARLALGAGTTLPHVGA